MRKNLKTVLVAPEEDAASHGIQGINDGAGFLVDRSIVDEEIMIPTQAAIEKARELMKKHGLLVGISSGANILACEKWIKENKELTNDITNIKTFDSSQPGNVGGSASTVAPSNFVGGNVLKSGFASSSTNGTCGLLDLVLLESKISTLKLIILLTKIFKGTHIHSKYVKYIQAKSIIIKPKINSILNIDGENKLKTPIEISVLPKVFKIFY